MLTICAGKRGKPKEAKGELKHVEFKKPRRKVNTLELL